MPAKRFAVIIFFLLLYKQVEAQLPVPKDAKTLYRQLSRTGDDTGRVNLLIDISRYNNAAAAEHPELVDEALETAGQANALSARLAYAKGLALSYLAMGQARCRKKDFKQSEVLIKKAIGILLQQQLYREAAEAYLNMEELYLSAGGSDYKAMIGYYEQARPLFNKAHAYDREGATLSVLGDFYQQIGEFEASLSRLGQALAAFKKAKYPNLQATYDLLGFVNMKISRFQEALRYGLLAEKTAIGLKDTSLLVCTIYTRIGNTYFVINKPELAGVYFNKALKVAEKFKEISYIRIVSQSLVNVAVSEHKYPKALALLKGIIRKYPATNREELIINYADYILIYTGLKNYNMAERYADTLLKTDVLVFKNSTTVYSLNALTEYLIQTGQYDRAGKYTPLFKRTAIEQSMKRKEYQAYLMNFKVDSAKKNYLSAIDNYRRYFVLKDSLYDLAKTGLLEELKIKFETGQKEQSIANLKKNNKLQEENLERAGIIRNISVAALLILAALMALLYKSYRINKQNSKAITQQNKELNQLVTEKEWLLKEIHHRVKNNLQIVTGLLQRQSAYINNDEALAAIQNSENRMHSIALIHQKLYQSESLGLISMQEYIEEMISYLKDSFGADNRILFEKHIDDIYLDVAQAVPLGLILNEAITNAIKYAYRPDEAGKIYITFVRNSDGHNQLTIADDGSGLPSGFDPGKADSLGLNLMRGLSKQLGGTFKISSYEGCTININFKTELFGKPAV